METNPAIHHFFYITQLDNEELTLSGELYNCSNGNSNTVGYISPIRDLMVQSAVAVLPVIDPLCCVSASGAESKLWGTCVLSIGLQGLLKVPRNPNTSLAEVAQDIWKNHAF